MCEGSGRYGQNGREGAGVISSTFLFISSLESFILIGLDPMGYYLQLSTPSMLSEGSFMCGGLLI